LSPRARRAIAAAGAFLALGGVAARSPAAVTKVKTDVEITNGGPTQFEGKVSSRKAACEAHRRVILFRLGAERKAEEAGKTRTDEKGNWILDGEFPDGDYKARAPETKPGKLVCLKGASQTLPAG
jgi:hypothetical protein